MSPSIVRSRAFATEEAKQNPEQPELTENEKKLTEDVGKLTLEVETLTEKTKELDVSLQSSLSTCRPHEQYCSISG